ncbi:MAG: 30S ribosomal protein S18 [Chlamydiota bacterium]|nr:30S ribosomal protein S18 [Chlamydiota bacterium]
MKIMKRSTRMKSGNTKILRKKKCKFCVDKVEDIDYKDVLRLRKNLTERGKIIPRRITGNCSTHQRQLALSVKRARFIALIPYVSDQ